MHQGVIIAGMLAGGLGLFMLAVTMITDGLKLAAGKALRDVLSKWTDSFARGIVSGIGITALVQSSSAVTVATIGFVNAGLITMQRALGVVYGSNIGTTMTGWLVAAVGFTIKVEAFALPLIGIGMLMRLTGGDSRRAPLGITLAGFGLFFLGIGVLQSAFADLAASIDFSSFTLGGTAGVFLYLGIGFLMTLLTQSSSAAIALTLTAATGGIVSLHAAAAMVIGANVGTTSTAVFAIIGATPNAKRVAAAHVMFNLGTAVVALLTLPLLFWLVKHTEKLLGLEDIPAVTLALFHTTFNILGVLMIWPVSNRLARFLEKRFVTQNEIEGRPRYLDKTVAVSPLLALNALVLELLHIAAVVRGMCLAALSVEASPGKRIASDHLVVEKLTSAVAEFITRLERGSLTGEVSELLTKVLRAERNLLACADLVLEVTKAQTGLKFIQHMELLEGISNYRSRVAQFVGSATPEAEGFSFPDSAAQMERIQASYDEAKLMLLQAGAALLMPIPGMIDTLDQNSRIQRMAVQLFKAIRYLSELYETTELQLPKKEKGKPMQH